MSASHKRFESDGEEEVVKKEKKKEKREENEEDEVVRKEKKEKKKKRERERDTEDNEEGKKEKKKDKDNKDNEESVDRHKEKKKKDKKREDEDTVEPREEKHRDRPNNDRNDRDNWRKNDWNNKNDNRDNRDNNRGGQWNRDRNARQDRGGGGWNRNDNGNNFRQNDRKRPDPRDNDPSKPAWATGKVMDRAAELKQRQQLWKKPVDGEEASSSTAEPPVEKNAGMWSAAFTAAAGGNSAQSSKFMKLMGIKNAPAVADNMDDKTVAAEQAKQKALMAGLEKQYEVSREFSHQGRGKGLGFGGY